MILPCLYLISLVLAPQLWLDPFVGLPTDVILMPLWLAVLIIKGDVFRNKMTDQDKLLLLFVFWLGLSMAVNGNILAHDEDRGYLLILYIQFIVLYLFFIWSLQADDRWKKIAVFFVCLCVLLAIEGIQHKLTGTGWAGQRLGWVAPEVLKAGGTGRTRWVGIFDGPGVFCVLYTIALPFILIGLDKVFSTGYRILSLAALLLVLIAIYFNGSRGGLLTTLTIFVMHFGWNLKKSKASVITGIVIASLLFMAAPNYMTEVNDSSKSTYHRIEMWAEGFEMVTQNPVFGIGRGNFRIYTSKLIAHNSAVEIMGETGLIGLFAWFGLIYMALKNILVYIKQESLPVNRLFARALFIAISGYVISSMFVTLEYVTFYILLSLAGILGRKLEEQNRFTFPDKKMVGAACIGFVGTIYVTVRWFGSIYF